MAHLLVQLLLPLRPLVLAGFDPLDAVHTKAHTLLSWRFMAVSTRNFFNFSLRSTRLGATFVMLYLWLFFGVYLGWLHSQMRARVWERFGKTATKQSSIYFSSLSRICAVRVM